MLVSLSPAARSFLAGLTCLTGLAASCSGAAATSSEDPGRTDVPLADLPPAVRTGASCDGAGSDSAWRQAFDGRFLFGVRCPGNNQNSIESLVAADDAGGRGAAVVVFPGTAYSGGEPITELSNVRIFPATRTIGAIFVDNEHPPGRPCRFESLFRFEGHTPRLVFHRSSKRCDEGSNMRWRTTLDERTAAEKRENWR